MSPDGRSQQQIDLEPHEWTRLAESETADAQSGKQQREPFFGPNGQQFKEWFMSVGLALLILNLLRSCGAHV